MPVACGIIALLEGRNQCFHMDHDVLICEFEEKPWSYLPLVGCGCNISLIVSRKFNAGMPSMRFPASIDTITASVLQSDTAVFLRTHEIGTHVCDPQKHITPSDGFCVRHISCNIGVLD